MSRPRRAASQKVIQEQKLDLSEDESDGDFSSESSNDYDPYKSKNEKKQNDESSFEESENDSSDEEGKEEEETFTTKNTKSNRRSRGNKSTVATLRKEAINKFSTKQLNTSQKLQDILKKAQYRKKSVFNQSDSDSESEKNNDKVPTFDCSGGLRLSGSDDSSDDEMINLQGRTQSEVYKTVEKKSSNLISSINEESGKSMEDLKAIHDNLQKMKHAREKLSNYHASDISKETTNDDDIESLLAMGEGSSKKSGASQKRSKKASQADDSDSDNWEEVEDDSLKTYTGPKEDVEILLNNLGEGESKKETKPVDVEAQLKRKFNRKRKEFQEHLHKTELMCWISHCNFVNERLNNPILMQCALKMLPPTKNKSQYYPKDKTDIEYFTQVTKWFKQTITLRNQKMYCELKKRPPLIVSLALQMKYKTAICRRDYVLIFIVLLRAIGIQCRMIQSLVLDPKICPKSELMSLSMKKEEKESSSKKSSKQSSKTSNSKSSKTSSKSKKSSEKPKIPQLDGADDGPEMSKKQITKPKRSVRIRGSSDNKVDESYIDINKISKHSSPVSKRLTSNGDSENLSPKVKIVLNASNQNKASLSEKIKKNAQVERLNHLQSPRKTRSASREGSPKINISKSIDKNSKTVKVDSSDDKKDTLKVFSPRRLRSRSHSTEVEINQEKKSPKKPNLKSLSEKKSPTNSKNDDKPKKDTLKVLSPRKLRSRSRSMETDKNKSVNYEKTINKDDKKSTASRKRSSNIKENDAVESKKSKIQETAKASRKRSVIKDDNPIKPKKSRKSEEHKTNNKEEDGFSEDSLKYFKTLSSKKKTSESKSSNEPKPSTSSKQNIDRRILSSDDEVETTMKAEGSTSPKKKNSGIDIWVELYSEKDEKWISIDILRAKLDSVKEICQKATHPLVYVFAWNNDKSVKDVSARYCANLNTSVRKMRVDREYLSSILNIYNSHYVRTSRDLKEDEELNQVQFAVPMPTSIAEFKNHPLYVLKRHLLKYQAIYPPEPPILGYIRDEAIYPRDCCFTLHSRETWLKEARTVKLNEKPYKIAKTLRWDRATNKLHKDIPLELFGIWQTKDYEPPVAENGIVPRNAYGNVELFKECMLPIGTVHLELPGLNKICKKIGVDCSQAIVGFDSTGGWPFPVYKGFVVCKEFEEKVIDAWAREQEESEHKEREKFEKRVYGNWKKLIKGLLIRERLMRKYNFQDKH